MSNQSENPFVGLRPFETDESLLFFGRQDQILELLQKLHDHHFVAIIGSSGSGKSSLIKAGLIPRLKAGYLVNQRDQWLVAIMKPGQTPLYNLALSIYTALGFTDQHQEIEKLVTKIRDEGSDALVDLLQHLWKKQNTSVFILVDQFEELFRFSSEKINKDESIEFVNILLDLASRSEIPVYTSITMRSDFIGDCDQFYGLPEALNRSQYLVPRLNRVQLKSAIEAPVKLYGGKINTALTSKLLNEVQSTKDELPLLQHLLMRIWDYEEKTDHSGELDLKDYEEVGGIAKALSNHAEEALVGMSDDELRSSKKIFQALTAVDDNGRKIRRPAKLSELIAITRSTKEQILHIINQFNSDKRSFIVLNMLHGEDDILVDISHESLIRQWERLGTWVDEEAEGGKAYLQLADSALLFKKNKKDLLSGSELQMASLWFNEFKPEKDWGERYDNNFDENIKYLKASVKESKKQEQNLKIQKRRKYILYTVLLVIILGSTGAIIRQREIVAEDKKREAMKAQQAADYAAEQAKDRESEKRAKEDTLRLMKSIQEKDSTYKFQLKKINDAYKYVEVAKQFSGYDPTMAMRLAELAIRNAPDTLIKYFALNLIEEFAYYHTILPGDYYNTGGSIPSFCSSDGTMYFSSQKNRLGVWETRNNKKIITVNSSSPDFGEFSDDNKFIVLRKYDYPLSKIEIIDLNDGSVVKAFEDSIPIISACFGSKNAGAIIIQDQDSNLKLWNTKTNKCSPIDSNILYFSVNIAAKEMVTVGRDQTISIWNLSNGKKLRDIKNGVVPKSEYERINSITYSKENKLIAISSPEKLNIIDNQGNDILEIPAPQKGEFYKVYFLQPEEVATDVGSSQYIDIVVSSYSGNFMMYSLLLEGKKAKILTSKSYLGNVETLGSVGGNSQHLYTTSNYDGIKLWGYREGKHSLDETISLLKGDNLDRLPPNFDENEYLKRFTESVKKSIKDSKKK
jgi:WD40 repeat protein